MPRAKRAAEATYVPSRRRGFLIASGNGEFVLSASWVVLAASAEPFDWPIWPVGLSAMFSQLATAGQPFEALVQFYGTVAS